jgi:hypothetical protein
VGTGVDGIRFVVPPSVGFDADAIEKSAQRAASKKK